MPTAPAFQFYASDYLSSSSVEDMTLEAEGAYVRLLARQWLDGWIPNDIGKLSKFCKRISQKRMADLWETYLKGQFEEIEPGRLANAKLEEVRQNQERFIASRRDAGRKGNEEKARRKADAERAQSDGTADAQRSPSSSSSTSSSKKKNKTPRSDDRRVAFRDFMFDQLRTIGIEPVTGPKTWKAYEAMLTSTAGKDFFALDRLKEFFTRFIKSPDPFHRRQGDPIQFFCLNINAFTREDYAASRPGNSSENRGRVPSAIRAPAYIPKQ
jgi:uncharacterized protein YdaU (DUF1376 family)